MKGFSFPDARGWIGIGTFVLTVMIFAMIGADKGLLKDDFFKTLATIVISTGFINGVVSWAYGGTKSGGELAANNAAIVSQAAGANPPAPEGTGQ